MDKRIGLRIKLYIIGDISLGCENEDFFILRKLQAPHVENNAKENLKLENLV